MSNFASTTVPLALDSHHEIGDWSDRVAFAITRSLRFLADTFFAKRYGNRAIVLETVAAVPGMVGAVNYGSGRKAYDPSQLSLIHI